MITIRSQAGKKTYNLMYYLADYEDEIPNLPKGKTPGSEVYVTESGNTYILTHGGQWVIKSSGGGTGSNLTLEDVKNEIQRQIALLSETETDNGMIDTFKEMNEYVEQHEDEVNELLNNSSLTEEELSNILK